MANDLTPREMIDAIVRESGMGDALRAENSDEAYSRLENLGELASAAAQYDTLLDFVERMALVADSDQFDGGAGAISMMTLHVAKGLEFPAVVIAGLEETVFPHRRALADDAELEEERRLCYVGITRAMRHLGAHSRARVAPCGVKRTTPIASRFLQEIPRARARHLVHVMPMRRSISSETTTVSSVAAPSSPRDGPSVRGRPTRSLDGRREARAWRR